MSHRKKVLKKLIRAKFLFVIFVLEVAGRCVHPGVPIGGRLSGSRFEVGSTVTFSCDRNRVLVGEAVQECLYFFEWSGKDGLPRCVGN